MNRERDVDALRAEYNETISKLLSLSSEIDKKLKSLESQTQQWTLLQQQIEKNSISPDQKIKFDVGGKIFSTSKSTMLSVKGTYFEALLGSGKWKADHDGCYFIDRNPKYFGLILDYLRYGEMDLSEYSAGEIKKVKIELDYYQIPGKESEKVDDLYEVKLSTLGGIGRFGPTSLKDYSGMVWEKDIVLDQGKQVWTVPVTAYYVFTVAGAKGGDTTKPSVRPGWGSVISASVALSKGDIITILVGQKGVSFTGVSSGSIGATGGGGGSFVVKQSEPLIIAAGGNGTNWSEWLTNGPGGQITTDLTNHPSNNRIGRGSNGGGFEMDATNETKSYKNGGAGGIRLSESGTDGGFGGGGGSLYEGGGGGGYIGGIVVPSNLYDQSFPSYGAFSFISKNCKLLSQKADENNADGYVFINILK